MRQWSTRVAPAKIILLGEHSVVYGEPAIAATIDRRLRVTVTRGRGRKDEGGDDSRLRAAITRAARGAGFDEGDLRVEIDSEIPPGAGLGSSAALSVALVTALADLAGALLAPDEIVARAADVENVFHGTSSGLDVATVAHGGLVGFERGRVERLGGRSGAPLEVVVALSGERRSTRGPVARLGACVAARPEPYRALFRAAGDLVRLGTQALREGDWGALGAIFDAAHELLGSLGVSTPVLEGMVRRAREAGAVGAKLSGAGGGGAILALAPGREREVAAALAADGFEAFVTRIGAKDEEVEDGESQRRTA